MRWFTPAFEVDLCGHATLAAAHALWQSEWQASGNEISFASRSGELIARPSSDLIELNFPAQTAEACEIPAGLLEAIPVTPTWFGKNREDFLIQVATPAEVLNIAIDFPRLGEMTERGIMVTSESGRDDCDFISRFFAPRAGINEDPVTGSAHCCLCPFWAERMKKNALIGYQASPRGGFVRTTLEGPRVRLAGRAITIFQGELQVPVA